MSTHLRTTLAACAFVLLAGCGRSCKTDHPYVPYSIGDEKIGDTSLDAGSEAAAGVEQDAGPREVAANVAPVGATRWSLDGLDLEAPAGRVFTLGIARDFDGDGAKDALAVMLPEQTPNAGGELYFFRGRRGGGVEPAIAVGTAPPMGGDVGCTATRRLGQIGPHSALVELAVACPPNKGVPMRWLALVIMQPLPRVHFSAQIVDPPNAPKLTIDADGADADGDGIDDVALRVSVEGGSGPFEPGPRMTALVRWFDRPAGLSRAPDEPEASLRARAGVAATHAVKTKDALLVPLEAQTIRALFGAICAEGGSPRITQINGGGPMRCGPSHALEEAGLAVVRAHATLADPLRAIAALDRAQVPPATRTPGRTTEAQQWIAQAAPIVNANTLRAIAALPLVDRGHAPAWGALMFEPSGKLLVRTPVGVVREDPTLGDEADAPEVPSWKPAVLSPDGATRWIEAYYACDAFALHATFAPTKDGDPRDVVLPIAPPLAQRCVSGVGEPARALPIAWGPRGLEGVVAGEPVIFSSDLVRASLAVGSLDQPVSPGAPRSPNGKVLCIPTSQGIFVRAAKPRLYRAKELENGYLELRDCTITDDATHVACLRGGRAFVGSWDVP